MKGVQSSPGKPDEKKGVAVDPGSPLSPAYISQGWIDSLLDLVSAHVKVLELTREEKFNEALRRDERRDKPRDNLLLD